MCPKKLSHFYFWHSHYKEVSAPHNMQVFTRTALVHILHGSVAAQVGWCGNSRYVHWSFLNLIAQTLRFYVVNSLFQGLRHAYQGTTVRLTDAQEQFWLDAFMLPPSLIQVYWVQVPHLYYWATAAPGTRLLKSAYVNWRHCKIEVVCFFGTQCIIVIACHFTILCDKRYRYFVWHSTYKLCLVL